MLRQLRLARQSDGQHAIRFVVQADAAEVDRQIHFETADYDLEDAAQVVPLADRARDPVQQVQAVQLQLQSSLRSVERNCDVGDLARAIDCGTGIACAAGPGSCDFGDRCDRSRDASGRIGRCRDRRSHD